MYIYVLIISVKYFSKFLYFTFNSIICFYNCQSQRYNFTNFIINSTTLQFSLCRWNEINIKFLK